MWTWEIPAYFFVGGASGIVAVIGFIARVTKSDRKLVRDARRVAAIGAALSAPLLIADLGRPERFLNMLRVLKLQSPMSVGSWTLAVFGASTSAAAVMGGGVGDVAAFVSAIAGLNMATYTGVLLGATAIPVWSANVKVLPAQFAASATGSAVSVLELRGHDQRALHLLGLAAAAFETVTAANIDTRGDRESDPLRAGMSGALTHIANVLSGPVPLVLRLIGKRKAAAAVTLVGSLVTRFAWVEAGRASVKDVDVALGQGATMQRVSESRSGNESREGSAASAKPMPPVSSEK